jgi:hypothetical protein
MLEVHLCFKQLPSPKKYFKRGGCEGILLVYVHDDLLKEEEGMMEDGG